MSIDPILKTYVEEGRALSRQIDAVNESKPFSERLTQVDIARHLGMTTYAMNNYLSGRRPINLTIARVIVALFNIPLSSYSPRLHDELVDFAGALLPSGNIDLSPAAPLPPSRQITSKSLIAWDNLNENLIRLPMTSFQDIPKALDAVERSRVVLSNQIQSDIQSN